MAALVCLPAAAATYPITPATHVIGEDQHILASYTDTLYDLGEKYGIGSEEIIRANPNVDPWLPGAGTDILIPGRQILPPGPREGIVVNIPEHRLYYYPKPRRHQPPVVVTYPVSIGSMDWKTPQGQTRVIQKISHPTWHPPLSIREEHKKNGDPLPSAVPPGPKNPLGAFALRLDLSPGDYLIHGTNNPLAVGMPVTHGCIRLYPRDIEALFAQVPVGTKVTLLNEPVKVAVQDGEVLVQAQPPADTGADAGEPQPDELQRLHTRIDGAHVAADIDWDGTRDALAHATGLLVTVGHVDAAAAPAPRVAHAAPRAHGRRAPRRHHSPAAANASAS